MDGLVSLLIRRPGRVLVSFGVILLVAVLLTGRLQFQQDVLDLLPQDNRAFQVLSHIIRSSDGQDTLYLLLTRSDAQDKTDLAAAAQPLIEDLRNLTIAGQPAFLRVSAKKDEAISREDFAGLLKRYIQEPTLFLPKEDITSLESYLHSPAELAYELQRTLALLATPGTGDFSRILTLDPFNLRRFLVDKLHALQGGISFADGPYMLAPDKNALLVVGMPTFAAIERDRSLALFDVLHGLKNRYPEFHIGLTGGYAMAVEEESLVRGDLISTIVGSAFGIGLLFFLAYRRLLVLLFIILPLGVGLQLALGLMALVWGRVHMMAVAFSAVVLGLGIDFAIHVYDRFASERALGTGLEESTRRAVTNTGRAVVAGCLTTLAAFSALIVTGSPVVRQIGWLVSLGLIFCLVAIIWALPARLVLADRAGRHRVQKKFRRLGMDRLGHWVGRRPGTALFVSGLVLLLCAAGVPRLTFEKDIMALHPAGLESMTVRERIQEAFGGGAKPLLVSWTATDPADLWRTGDAIDGQLRKFQALGDINGWASLTSLSSGGQSMVHDDGAAIRQVLGQFGMTDETFDGVREFLTGLVQTSPARFADCQALSEVFPRPYHRFFICEKGKTEGIAWVYGREENSTALQAKMAAIRDDILVISPESALAGLMAESKHILLTTAVLTILLVAGIIYLFFRNVADVALALLPTILGLITAAGVMGFLSIPINLVNFIIIPILIGIGVDDGIHIVDRFREQGNVEQTLASTGRSVFMTTLTTCLGFGSLALADYHVLASMGILTIVGVSACFFYSTVALPALLLWRERAMQNRSR